MSASSSPSLGLTAAVERRRAGSGSTPHPVVFAAMKEQIRLSCEREPLLGDVAQLPGCPAHAVYQVLEETKSDLECCLFAKFESAKLESAKFEAGKGAQQRHWFHPSDLQLRCGEMHQQLDVPAVLVGSFSTVPNQLWLNYIAKFETTLLYKAAFAFSYFEEVARVLSFPASFDGREGAISIKVLEQHDDKSRWAEVEMISAEGKRKGNVFHLLLARRRASKIRLKELQKRCDGSKGSCFFRSIEKAEDTRHSGAGEEIVSSIRDARLPRWQRDPHQPPFRVSGQAAAKRQDQNENDEGADGRRTAQSSESCIQKFHRWAKMLFTCLDTPRSKSRSLEKSRLLQKRSLSAEKSAAADRFRLQSVGSNEV